MKTEIPFSRPFLDSKEIDSVSSVIKNKWITTGEKVKQFETLMRLYLDVDFAMAVSSGTAALDISLAVKGVGPGDDIITTPYTFASTVLSIIHRGATPILVDVDPINYNIDPDKIEELIREKYRKKSAAMVSRESGNRLRGILPVHFAGQPADMDRINAIAGEYNLFVVEDAAHAIGAKYRGDFIGHSKNPVCFSFYSNKNMTTGEGGMIVTNRSDESDRYRMYSLHGISKSNIERYQTGSPAYDVLLPGFKNNMTDISAAIGIEQLRKLDDINSLRKKTVNCYNKALAEIDEIGVLDIAEHNESAFHLYPIQLQGNLKEKRDLIIQKMKEKEIHPSIHFIPVHLFTYFRQYFEEKAVSNLKVSEDLYQREISLPLFPEMTETQVDRVASTLKDILAGLKN